MSIESIDTAPKDGTVILSNDGTVCFKNNCWGIPNGWYLCDMNGNIPKCADDGYDISRSTPTTWLPNGLDAFN